MSQLHQLYRLQQIDTEIQEQKKRLVAILTAQKEPASLVALRGRSTTAVETVHKLRAQQKDAELQLGSVQSKLKQAEDRLYSGKVRNPKELEDLQEAVAAMKRQRSVLEEQLLEVMMVLEEAESESTAVSATLAHDEQTWADKLSKLKHDQMEVATAINALSERRTQQIQQVQSDKLAEYEQVRQKKGGVAVSRVKQNMCERCRTGLPEALIKAVNQGEYKRCPSCGRILAPMV